MCLRNRFTAEQAAKACHKGPQGPILSANILGTLFSQPTWRLRNHFTAERVGSHRGLMKLLLYPAVEPERQAKIAQAAGVMQVVNAADEATALREITDADGFYGKVTAPLLAAARKLRWVQSPTASL